MFQTIGYRGHWLHLTTHGNYTHVKVQSPNGTQWQHSYSSLAGAKAAVRAIVNRSK